MQHLELALIVATLGNADVRGDPTDRRYRDLFGDYPPYLSAIANGADPERAVLGIERRFPSRKRGDYLLEHYDAFIGEWKASGPDAHPPFRLPILGEVLRYVVARPDVGPATRLVLHLLGTDQTGRGIEPRHLENDTQALARFVTRWLSEYPPDPRLRVRGAGLPRAARRHPLDRDAVVTANPSDYGLYAALDPWFTALRREYCPTPDDTERMRLFVSVTAGADGLKFAMLINGLRRFQTATGNRCTLLYVPDAGPDSGGRAQEIEIGPQVLAEQQRHGAALADHAPFAPATPARTDPDDDAGGVDRGSDAIPDQIAGAAVVERRRARAALGAAFARCEARFRRGDARGFLAEYLALLAEILGVLVVERLGLPEYSPEAIAHWSRRHAVEIAALGMAPADDVLAPQGYAAWLDVLLPALGARDSHLAPSNADRLLRAYVGLYPAPDSSLNAGNQALQRLHATALPERPIAMADLAACYRESFFGLDRPGEARHPHGVPLLVDLRFALAQILRVPLPAIPAG